MFAATLATLLLYTQAAIGQSGFQLNVQIAANQLPLLKGSGYNLCIAKQVNQKYTVVWSGNQAFLQNNIFQWQESYQVFGATALEAGSLVTALTNSQDIQSGQTSILSNIGLMQPATGGIGSGPFFFANEYGAIGIGVKALLDNEYLPIYNSPLVIPESLNSLQPTTTVKIWFALNQNTSTMFLTSESAGFEVVYQDVTSQTISYSGPVGNGSWAYGPVPPNSISTTLTTTSPSSTTSSTLSATQTPYGQCGGQGWTGPTACAAGFKCSYSNPYFSECL